MIAFAVFFLKIDTINRLSGPNVTSEVVHPPLKEPWMVSNLDKKSFITYLAGSPGILQDDCNLASSSHGPFIL